MEEPRIKVGICDHYPHIEGTLNGPYRLGPTPVTGEFTAQPAQGMVILRDGFGREILRAPEIRLAADQGARFTLHGVTIGVRFHWERRAAQTFAGDLTLLATGESLTAINEILLEDYLASVVSSEMNGEAPAAFLQAHAVASRSWLVAMLIRKAGKPAERVVEKSAPQTGEILRWYDREDHESFDVCADDHCQRYQGLSGEATGGAREAVRKTRGVFLISDGEICDARYHKACGGMTDNYRTCWEERTVPYLTHVTDAARPLAPIGSEEEAERWILSCPDVCCRTGDRELLSRILPDFDRETADFFRWQVHYEREALESILLEKAGIDFGTLQGLTPMERGPSGRISRLKIEGTRTTCIVGKELEIRRWLSPSHLYSSAFIVSTERAATGFPIRFTLYGAGWGHGVGLCQIGAAVMADQGCNADEILQRYFRGAALVKRY